jgi:hypothetical protein
MDDPRGWRNGQTRHPEEAAARPSKDCPPTELRPSRLASLAPQDDEAEIRLARIWE